MPGIYFYSTSFLSVLQIFLCFIFYYCTLLFVTFFVLVFFYTLELSVVVATSLTNGVRWMDGGSEGAREGKEEGRRKRSGVKWRSAVPPDPSACASEQHHRHGPSSHRVGTSPEFPDRTAPTQQALAEPSGP